MKSVTSVEVRLAYDEQWLATGFNLSPLNMECKSSPQAAPDPHLFGGLMGVFADSLPDETATWLASATWVKCCKRTR
jgi:hypothetical protein